MLILQGERTLIRIEEREAGELVMLAEPEG
jgi:hypothetical protein